MAVIYNNMTEYKIYKIVSSQTDRIYIGSTKKTLTERLSGHKCDYKAWLKDNTEDYITSFEILKFNDYVIELIELCICIDKLERNEKEGQFIKLNKLICVNKKIEGRTKKEYRHDHVEQIKQYKKQFNKQYYQDNQEKIKERATKKHICEICNGKYTHQNKTIHEKSNKHIKKLNQSKYDTTITYNKDTGHIKQLLI